MVNKIRELREKKGITQEHVASALGVKQATVSMWETGSAKPRMDKLPALASVLGCSIEDLFS